MSSYLSVQGVTKRFGDRRGIAEVSFELAESEMLALLGPSGAGKTTTIRCIAGLEQPDDGDIHLQGSSWLGVPPGERDVAVVFPTYSLYFHMTVRENIAFPLRVRGATAVEIQARVAEAAGLLGITALLDRKPRQISGGERQRVAIGRAIVRRPRLFLFDEPLTFLDAKLREQLRVELRRIQRELGIAAIFVTSDPAEALTVGDRIAVIDQGRILQVGSARDLYGSPSWRFVGDLFSRPHLNVLPVRVTVGTPTRLEGDALTIEWPGPAPRGDRTVFAFRPEETEIRDRGSASVTATAIAGRVRLVENMGSFSLVYVETAAGPIAAHVTSPLPAGGEVDVVVPVDRAFLFDPDTGARLDGVEGAQPSSADPHAAPGVEP